MNAPLSGRTALVTGASAGIGEACAVALAAAGARVVVCGRREARLEALQQKLAGESKALLFDVRERAEVESALATLKAPWDGVDILVNSAGLAVGVDPAHAASMDDFQAMVDTNVLGLLYVTGALLPGMVQRNRGHVVNLGSVAANYPYPGGNVYGATKAFVHQFTQNLKSDLVGTHVRVTNVEPGMVETEFSVVRFRGDEQKAKAVYAGMQPLVAADIADIVVWAVTRPPHVNINVVEVMPADQAFGPFAVKRHH